MPVSQRTRFGMSVAQASLAGQIETSRDQFFTLSSYTRVRRDEPFCPLAPPLLSPIAFKQREREMREIFAGVTRARRQIVDRTNHRDR